MFAAAAAVCFLIALILHLFGSGHASLVLGWSLGGLLSLSVHFLFVFFAFGPPWVYRRPPA